MTRSLTLATLVAVLVSHEMMAQTSSGTSPEAILDRAVAAYANMKTARAEFQQTLTNPLLGASVSARGEFVRRHPNLIAITFTDPAGDVIVADGKAVWAYLPSSYPGQVFKSTSMGEAGNVDPAAQFVRAPKQRYDVSGGTTAVIAGRATRMIVLTPKKGVQGVGAAKVWVDDEDGTIRQFEVVEQSGVTRRVLITKLVKNPEVKSSVFSFTPPKGVKIVDPDAVLGERAKGKD